MKKVWARIGMSVEVTDEEYKEIKKNFGCEDELSDEVVAMFISRGKPDGDSYIPDSFWWDEEDEEEDE